MVITKYRKMPTLIITVDPQCCRCITKIQNILCCIQDRGEFVIDKISYEKDKVLVSGPFDAAKLYCKLWCKAGKIIKGIEVDKPPPKPEPKPEPVTCQLVPWPYPYPYPQHPPSTWPPCESGCPTSHCECPSKPPLSPPPTPPPPPPPAPSKPPTCVCPTWPSCHCCSYPSTPMPYPALLVSEENPPYGACAVM